MKRREAIILGVLVGLGSLQIIAAALRMPRVKGIAAALQISPAMQVFTAHDGYETHAARFELQWIDRAGTAQVLALDPKTYANVVGPYNRRNVYGAAFAYGPLLRADSKLRTMQESVLQYALCSPATLRSELNIPADATQLTARVVPVRKPTRKDLEYTFEVKCHA